MADENRFLEWEQLFGASYGTPLDAVEKAMAEGKDIILSVDVKGARSVKKKFPEAISIFIMPPSQSELEKRLRTRNTEGASEMNIRMKESAREMKAQDEYDYLIVNKDIKEAISEFSGIIEHERMIRGKKPAVKAGNK